MFIFGLLFNPEPDATHSSVTQAAFMSQNNLLSLLADGEVHSGESLAAILGVSRTAVWKQIQKLQADGMLVHRIRGKGYRLDAALDLLDREVILAELSGETRRRVSLEVSGETVSTNSDIQSRWREGQKGILICLADSQSGGRGRQGRPWVSPRGKNIYISFGFTIARGFAGLDGLSLVAGLALARALRESGLEGAGLKWPNDIQVDGKKLAGVLIELQGELEGAVRVVVGLGVNVHMSDAKEIDQPWTSLSASRPGIEWQRNLIVARLVEKLVQMVDEFEKEGFAPFRAEWQALDVLHGRPVLAVNGELAGIGDGISGDARYRVVTDREVALVGSGEISLRVAE